MHVLLLDNTDVLLDYNKKQVGFASHHLTIEKKELIDEPLQIILNCAVILLLCFFVAMVLIEFIKYMLGLEQASSDSFETFMLKRSQ